MRDDSKRTANSAKTAFDTPDTALSWNNPPNPDHRPLSYHSPQPSQHEVHKDDEHNNPTPKDPLVLLRPPLHHAHRISTDPQRRPNTIQLPLRALQDLPLIAQVSQHSPSSLKVLIQRSIRRAKEALLLQRMILPLLVCSQTVRRLVRAIRILSTGSSLKVGVIGAKQRVDILSPARTTHCRRIRVRVLGRLARVRSSTQQL